MADLVITSSQVLASSGADIIPAIIVQAGQTITAGMVVVLSAAGEWYPADASLPPPTGVNINSLVGIALNNAVAGQPLSVCISDPNLDLGAGAALTVGQTYIVSGAAAGGIAPISDIGALWYRCILGAARSPGPTLKFLKIATGATA